jgi:transcriptional regulator with XRE-family HTH domain
MTKSLRSPRQIQLQKLLAEVRAKAGLTQMQFAERLHRPQSFIAKYEGGERRIDVVEFCDIAGALGADPVALFEEFLGETSEI